MMRWFLIFLLTTTFCLCAAAQSPPSQPTAWPSDFFATATMNSTTKAGIKLQLPPTGFENRMKWYSWHDDHLLREDCQRQGISSTFLVNGTDTWIFNRVVEKYVYIKLPVGAVTPNWMIGGNYTATQIVNGAPSWCFDKADHIYCQSIESGEPARVFTPLDQRGYSSDEYYNVFVPAAERDASVFIVPSYCPPAGSPAHFPLSPSPADPASCFVGIPKINNRTCCKCKSRHVQDSKEKAHIFSFFFFNGRIELN
jgi:hypothetical protein